MSNTSTFPLRLPKHVKDDVARVAKRDGTSANQFIATAVAEKLAVMNAREYFEKIAQSADVKKALSILNRQDAPPPYPWDVMPPDLAKRMAQ